MIRGSNYSVVSALRSTIVSLKWSKINDTIGFSPIVNLPEVSSAASLPLKVVASAIVLGFSASAVCAAEAAPQPAPSAPAGPTTPSMSLAPAPAGTVANEHTAKWRVYTDRAREQSIQGNMPDAEAFLLRALEEARLGFGPRDPHVAAALQNLAELYRMLRRIPEAEPLYSQALDLLQSAYGELHPAVGTAFHNVAGFYVNKGDLATAQSYYEKALRVRSSLLGKRHAETATTSYHLGEVLRLRGRPSQAVPHLRESVAYFDEIASEASPVAIRRLGKLCEATIEAHRWSDLTPSLRRLVLFVEDTKAGGNEAAAQVAEGLASLLRAKGRRTESDMLIGVVIKSREEKYGDGHPLLARSLALGAESLLASPSPGLLGWLRLRASDPTAPGTALHMLQRAVCMFSDALSDAARRATLETANPREGYGARVEISRLSVELSRALRLAVKAKEMMMGAASKANGAGLYTDVEGGDADLVRAADSLLRARAEFDPSPAAAGSGAASDTGPAAPPSGIPEPVGLISAARRYLGLGGGAEEEGLASLRRLKAPTTPTKREIEAGAAARRALLQEEALLLDEMLQRLGRRGGRAKGAEAAALRKGLGRRRDAVAADLASGGSN